MARIGQVSYDANELNQARESLERELERITGATAPYLLQRLERLIDAKIVMSKSGY
jgi:hypothetical protein